MKIIAVAFNHIQLELDNGEVIDVNDGTAVPVRLGQNAGLLNIKNTGLTPSRTRSTLDAL